MITFTIPYPPTKKGKSAFCKQYGLNAYYSGKHWAVRKKDADTLHALTLTALHTAHIPRAPIPCPVSVTFFWDDGLDIDNHAAIGKAVVDALKGYLLPDDTRQYFSEVHHRFWRGGAIKVEIAPARGTPYPYDVKAADGYAVPAKEVAP